MVSLLKRNPVTRINPGEAVAAVIVAAIIENDEPPVRELMWGAAGSMLVALLMYEWTEEKNE